MIKTLDEYFLDWESSAFGYGYGSGEEYILPLLKKFMSIVPNEGVYDYKVLEEYVGCEQAWLLINVLCKEDIIQYGTSPKGGWLTQAGHMLKSYLESRTDEQLYESVTKDEDGIYCYKEVCNCDEETPRRKCPNPFWGR